MEKKQNVPALRFQGFSGEWKKKRLEEMGASFSYGLNAAATTYDGQHKYLRITDIDDESRKFSGKELTSPNVDLSSASDYLDYKLQENDIVFARTGASVGKTYLYDTSDGDVYYAGFLIRVKIDSKYDANFIFQKTLTSDYSHFVVVTSQRSGQPGINAQEYANWEMLVPELNEQKKIGRFLTDFDKNIFVCREKIKKLQQFRQAMLTKLFPREGAAEPELRFRGFPGPWTKCKLEECFSERTERSESGELLSVTINHGVRKFSETGRFNNSSDDKSNYKKVYIGDIAYNSMRMWQGASGYSSYEGIVSPAYTVIVPKKGMDSLFFSYVFKHPKMIHLFELHSQGITSDTWNLKFPAFSKIRVWVPSLEEQKQIAVVFKRTDDFISLQQKKLERMQRLKAALLEKLFV